MLKTMDIKQTSVNELRPGRYIVIDGAACIVKDIQKSKPGKHGSAKCRIEAVGIIDDVKRVIIKGAHDNIESPLIEKETAQVLSIAGGVATVMDMKSYETFELKIPEDMKEEVKEGGQVSYWVILGQKVLRGSK